MKRSISSSSILPPVSFAEIAPAFLHVHGLRLLVVAAVVAQHDPCRSSREANCRTVPPEEHIGAGGDATARDDGAQFVFAIRVPDLAAGRRIPAGELWKTTVSTFSRVTLQRLLPCRQSVLVDVPGKMNERRLGNQLIADAGAARTGRRGARVT
jgi:hypothetical protein